MSNTPDELNAISELRGEFNQHCQKTIEKPENTRPSWPMVGVGIVALLILPALLWLGGYWFVHWVDLPEPATSTSATPVEAESKNESPEPKEGSPAFTPPSTEEEAQKLRWHPSDDFPETVK